MLFFPIFCVYIVGLIILFLFKQDKYLNFFELGGFSFGIGLSLFVFELFLQGWFFDYLSFLPALLTTLFLLVIFILHGYKQKSLFHNVKTNFLETAFLLKKQFISLKTWQRISVIFTLSYVLFKIIFAFQLNTMHPTRAEDAVSGWDLKTKVFFENQSLVLDKNNPEFLGSVLTRSLFAPLSDFYFISLYPSFPIGLSNIISPLIYLNLFLILFGVLLRKTNLFFASLGDYLFFSLPFIFIHAFASYFNFISGYFLFTFTFYLSDQILSPIDKKNFNTKIVYPLAIFSFLDAVIRNENIYLICAVVVLEIVLFMLHFQKEIFIRFKYVLISMSGLITAFFTNKAINQLAGINTLSHARGLTGDEGENVLMAIWNNIQDPKFLIAPLRQAFYHPDYLLLYILFILALILFFVNFRQNKNIRMLTASVLLLYAIFITMLYAKPHLGLLTHLSFVRYPIALIPMVTVVSVIIFYNHFQHKS